MPAMNAEPDVYAQRMAETGAKARAELTRLAHAAVVPKLFLSIGALAI